MDEETLTKRTHEILHRLSGNDPKHHPIDFLMQLMDVTKAFIMRKSTPYEVTDERALRVITEATHWLVEYLERENKWDEFLSNWQGENVYETLAWRIGTSILPHRVV